jgi:hypothetical protein
MAQSLSLWEAFAEVPDPRSRSGQRHPLQAVLTLTTVAMLSGCRSLYAIAQFGRDRGARFAGELGFTREQTPCCTTLHYLFSALNRNSFEDAIRKWVTAQQQQGWNSVSIDGKTLRGTQGHEIPGVHVLAAYAHEAKIVLDQIPVQASTNEHKAALELLHLIPVKDKVVLGDAMFCQRDLSRRISKKGGDWIWPVKDNQPELRAALELAFEDMKFSPSGKTPGERRTPKCIEQQ